MTNTTDLLPTQPNLSSEAMALIKDALQLGLKAQQAGLPQEALEYYQAILDLNPRHAEALNLTGLLASQLGKFEQAVGLLQRAIEIEPKEAVYHYNLAVAFIELNHLDKALIELSDALYFKIDYPEATENLKKILFIKNENFNQDTLKFDEFRNFGSQLYIEEKFDMAISYFQMALEINPISADVYNDLGSALYSRGFFREAVKAYQYALAVKMEKDKDLASTIYCNLGYTLRKEYRFSDAASIYKHAIIIGASAIAYDGLGATLTYMDRIDEAIKLFQEAIKIDKKYINSYNNLGNALGLQGQLKEAIRCFRQVILLESDQEWRVVFHNNLLLTLLYSSEYSPESVYEEHLKFNDAYCSLLNLKNVLFDNCKEPHRRLKVGYISKDFRQHSVAYFIEPILAYHNKDQFEAYAYYNDQLEDDFTLRLRKYFDHWIIVNNLSDDALAEQIRQDGIDILVDLSGHTNGNRLLVFARKPAPVQITWLGYPASTGLQAMDYRITDVHAEPPGLTEHLNREALLRLPEVFCCYRPQRDEPVPVIDHPPSEDMGYITFGCFNNYGKVTPPVIALWSRILHAVPTAQLLLECSGLGDAAMQAQIQEAFAVHGISPDRLRLLGRRSEQQYVLYNQVDVAFDPFPCNGGTTSCDALWMGVPVITLAGRHFVSRMGVTFNTNVGLTDLIAQTEEEYVAIAVRLATDPQALRATRDHLRQRVEVSPLMDAPRFTRHLEQAFRQAWQQWCDNEQQLIEADIPNLSIENSMVELPALLSRQDTINGYLQLGIQAQQAGRLQEALTNYRTVLEIEPDHAEANNLIGTAELQGDHIEEAIIFLKKAAKLNQNEAIYHYNLAIALKKSQCFDESLKNIDHALYLQPNDLDMVECLRTILTDKAKQQSKNVKKAVKLYNEGAVLHTQGNPDKAIFYYQKAIKFKADFVKAYQNLGVALDDNGLSKQAMEAYQHALALDPRHANSQRSFGKKLLQLSRFDDAIHFYQRLLKDNPEDVIIHNLLGYAFQNAGQFSEAAIYFNKAIEINPNYSLNYNYLGSLLKSQGDLSEAINCYRHALSIENYRPESSIYFTNVLLTLQYAFGYSPEEIHAEHLKFDEHFCRELAKLIKPFRNIRKPDRRLKIGYISADFYRHSVAYFVEPTLACHDKTQFELYAYYNDRREDDFTRRLHNLFDHWMVVASLSDDALAERIRQDGIDILVDLSGHTNGNRLLVFARKPAPVQITWLGYPASTGLQAMDYRITDVYAEPPGLTEHLNQETLLRLPEVFCCYRSQRDEPVPVIDHPPSEDVGYITFGCFNNYAKITTPVIALWSRILHAMPTAQLLLECSGLGDTAMQKQIQAAFAAYGISPNRLRLLERRSEQQYVLYNQVDVALDPFPCNGGTTTCDALWMGVPVITLAGRHFVSRMGVTFNTNVGLTDLIAQTEEEYLSITVRLVTDPEALRVTRDQLRQRVEASPLMDAPRFTRHLEQAFRQTWQQWCQ